MDTEKYILLTDFSIAKVSEMEHLLFECGLRRQSPLPSNSDEEKKRCLDVLVRSRFIGAFHDNIDAVDIRGNTQQNDGKVFQGLTQQQEHHQMQHLKMIGCVRATGDIQNDALILDVAVLKKFRRKGIGRVLMLKLIDSMPTCGRFDLYCEPFLKQFYESCGFEMVQDDKDRNGRLLMRFIRH